MELGDPVSIRDANPAAAELLSKGGAAADLIGQPLAAVLSCFAIDDTALLLAALPRASTATELPIQRD